MGLFGNSEAKAAFDQVKNDYRDVKRSIIETQASIRSDLSKIDFKDRPIYEYLVQEDIDEARLNELGFSAWELVNFGSYTTGFGIGGNTSMKVHLRFVFKRVISAFTSDLRDKIDQLKKLTAYKAELVSEIEARGYNAE